MEAASKEKGENEPTDQPKPTDDETKPSDDQQSTQQEPSDQQQPTDEKLNDEKLNDEKANDVKPSDEKPNDETPTSEAVDEKANDEKPVEEKPSDPYDQLIQQVGKLDATLRADGLVDEQFKNQLGQLRQFINEIDTFANEYDYSPDHPYNGFRTFVKVVNRYFQKVAHVLEQSSRAAKLPIDLVQAFVEFVPLLVHQMEALKLIRELKNVNPDDIDSSMQIELKVQSHQIKLEEKQMASFYYQPVSGFWLPKSISEFFNKGANYIAFFLYPLSQSIPAMVNKRKMAKLMADRSINGSMGEMNKENKIRSLTMSTKPPPNSTVTNYSLTNRQNEWIIDKEDKKLIQNEKVDQVKNTKAIRLAIVKPKERKSDQVICHIHGGAWIMGKPEWCYQPLFKNWVNDLGVTVVSIDYSLAPAEMYPVALQEVTDTYIWLADSMKKNEVLEPLGFVPSDIVVTGESAGGNLTLSLAIVLAEIKKLSPEAVKLPKAFSPLYPCHSPAIPYISASGVLLDVVLNCNLRLKCSSVYLANDVADLKVSYLNGKNNPWFKDEAKVREFYLRVNSDRKSNPILHIFTYDSFDLLKEVPLYIQAAEFDPLLDDSIKIAKLWQGKVVFDVIPDVVHGFNFFKEFSPECKKGDDLLLERMKEALGS